MMPIYTYNALNSVLLVLFLDKCLGTNLIRQKRYWKFMVLILGLTFVFDNYAVYIGIYAFNPTATLNIFLPYAPLENFLMSFSLVTANIIVYEWYYSKKSIR